jgi:hypothetical protein
MEGSSSFLIYVRGIGAEMYGVGQEMYEQMK